MGAEAAGGGWAGATCVYLSQQIRDHQENNQPLSRRVQPVCICPRSENDQRSPGEQSASVPAGARRPIACAPPYTLRAGGMISSGISGIGNQLKRIVMQSKRSLGDAASQASASKLASSGGGGGEASLASATMHGRKSVIGGEASAAAAAAAHAVVIDVDNGGASAPAGVAASAGSTPFSQGGGFPVSRNSVGSIAGFETSPPSQAAGSCALLPQGAGSGIVKGTWTHNTDVSRPGTTWCGGHGAPT